MPAVEQVDAKKLLVDWLRALINQGTVSEIEGWTVGTVVAPGKTPAKFVQVRGVGGVPEQRVADRPRLDLRFWDDGSYLTEGTVERAARKVLARMRRDFRCRVVANPVALPDPADTTKTHVLMTVELLTRGIQA